MAKSAVKAQFHLRFSKGDSKAVGPGKIALLEAILKTGSISAAARNLGMSYRRAWLLVDDLNRHLAAPVVDREIGGKDGGGTTLTPVGKKLIKLYRGIEQTAYAKALPGIRELTQMLAK